MPNEPQIRSEVARKKVGMRRGEYRNASGYESTEEDFKLAQWNPTEEWLNGE